MINKLAFLIGLLWVLGFAAFAQQDSTSVQADSTKKMEPPKMTYEQLIAEFKQLKDVPEGTPLSEMQAKEKRLRELRDNASYLIRYMVDPLKKKAAEIQKLEYQRSQNQEQFNQQQEALKRAKQDKQMVMNDLRSSSSKRSQKMLAQMEFDSTTNEADDQEVENLKGVAEQSTGELNDAEKEYAKMKKELAPKEKLATMIRSEWAKLNNRIATQTDKAGVDAMKTFETLTLEQIYDVATKEGKLDVINYYKENIFYSKKPPQINCKSGVGGNWLKGINLDSQTRQQGCVGYVSSLNKNPMYNLIIVKLGDGKIMAILWGKNNEQGTADDMYKGGAIKVF